MPEILTNRLNVLVYAGNGTSLASLQHTLHSLRLLLPSYAITTLSTAALLYQPWPATCALLVFPGGADLPYCRALNGEGNRRIAAYVRRGGRLLGLCAGGYYASGRCEFELNNPDLPMRVEGPRELAFFPGVCRGCAFQGFVYGSEEGARAAEMRVADGQGELEGRTLRVYYNGGGVFVDANKYADRGVEVVARYTEPLAVDGGDGGAAVVYCPVGEGAALLTGTHPEYVPANLDGDAHGDEFARIVDALRKDDDSRVAFLRTCLAKLGLQVSTETSVPSLTRLHLSSVTVDGAVGLFASLGQIAAEGMIKDDNDTFRLVEEPLDFNEPVEPQKGDLNAVVKTLVLHHDHPPSKETPEFNHQAFYSHLDSYRSRSKELITEFGSNLMYGEVVTSTSTMLEKNPKFLSALPSGFTCTSTTQVAGRGRAGNVWLSPVGQLSFSTAVQHPPGSLGRAPVMFIQYLAALAVVQGIRDYDRGYEDLPVRLKWPNDIYALDSSDPNRLSYSKIGGVMVNAQYTDGQYTAVIGIGVNALNARPTTSLNLVLHDYVRRHGHQLGARGLPPLTKEKLLARILTTFEALYARFLRAGFDAVLRAQYHSLWLHTDQIVIVDGAEGGGGVAEGGRARIRGLSADGLLVAEQLGWEDRGTGKEWALTSDGNSFDFMSGLVRRKV